MASISSRHDHEMTGMSMAGMSSMGNGVPSLFSMQHIFWAFVGTAIGIATLSNILNRILGHQRITASRTEVNAAKPRSLFFRSHATFSAIVREYAYYSLPLSLRTTRFHLPPMGSTTILIAYLTLVIVACFYRLDPEDLLEWEDIAYRAGFIAICQLPLVILLAGKRNIIGRLTGVGYERLNLLHRWIARFLLFSVIIHAGYWLAEWMKYDYVMTKIKSDIITQKGLIAGGILLWLVVSSAGPIRGLSYEIFLVQHIVSWLAFLVALYTHVPAEHHIWIWLPLGFWASDRLIRTAIIVYTNLSLFHKNSSGLLVCKATFEKLDEDHTRITIANPPVAWEAGQHMFLACHSLAPLSSHPFTIASLPSDERIEFVVCAKKGATRRFLNYASKSQSLAQLPTSISTSTPFNDMKTVLLDGPYSCIRPLRQFDSLLFLAGSTGATFTVPLLRDIVQQWAGNGSGVSKKFAPPVGAVTRYIRFIWVVKKASSVSWFEEQLEKVVMDVQDLRNEGFDVHVAIEIHITSPSETPSTAPSFAKKAGIHVTVSIEQEPASSSASSLFTEEKTVAYAPGLSFLPGRPNTESVVRDTAEQALGEMAVIVCGPMGLVQDARNAVVRVSNERAVHKGTGAQGIYLHAEAFGYA